MQSKRSVIKREAWAAGTMIVLGLGAIAQASTYTIGSLARMGPGMFPAILGVLLVLLGLIIARTAPIRPWRRKRTPRKSPRPNGAAGAASSAA